MTKDEALKLALEALERMKGYGNVFLHRRDERNPHEQVCEAITAIKQALAAPVQEPEYKQLYEQVCEQYDVLAKEFEAIKQARSAPVQEPVAWMHEWDDGERIPMLRKREVDSSDIDSPKSVRPLVFGDITPPAAQRQWVGLTDEEIDHTKWIPKRGSQITYDIGWLDNMRIFARAIEAKLKEKNT